MLLISDVEKCYVLFNRPMLIHTEEICKKAGRQQSALTARLNWLFSERSSSATFNTAQPSGIAVVLQMLDVWKRFRRGL